MMIPVNEVFETIQGEARWTGHPSLFIRLQGCAVGCPWCDTKHTWKLAGDGLPENGGPTKVQMLKMLGKLGDSAEYCDLDPVEIVELVKGSPCEHVVITGGEPCDNDLLELTSRIIAECGKTVQIETSGTAKVTAHGDTWVTVSPKPDMPGGKVLLDEAMARANEIKMPVGRPADIVRLQALIKQYNLKNRPIWLQPLSVSPKATKLCVEMATVNGWLLSVQTHKYLGVR